MEIVNEYLGVIIYEQEMFTQYVEEKKELLLAIAKDRKLSDLPKITQPTLIVWGDQDKIFPLELGHRLKRFISPTGLVEILIYTSQNIYIP